MSDAPARRKRRVVVAITGASGVVFGLRILEILESVSDIETHLIVSQPGRRTLALECGTRNTDKLADFTHPIGDIGAEPSSGSARMTAMLVVPCSIRTLGAIAWGQTDNLIARAADVMLKERLPLLLAVRETPIHALHLESMLRLARLGAIIFPPVPAFYHHPERISDIVDHSCMRMLDQVGLELDISPRWRGQ